MASSVKGKVVGRQVSAFLSKQLAALLSLLLGYIGGRHYTSNQRFVFFFVSCNLHSFFQCFVYEIEVFYDEFDKGDLLSFHWTFIGLIN